VISGLALQAACAALAAAILSVLATGLVLGYLRRRQILDRPNERSSHTLPTPRGGGLGVVPAVLLCWAWLALGPGPIGYWAWGSIAAALLLMIASWIDDRHSLPSAPRFLGQFVVVAGTLALLPADALVFQGWLPFAADRVVAAIAWVWFVNVFNFMDGIDGITGVEAGALGIGIALVSIIGESSPDLAPFALAVAGAGLGFLVWNWHPAKLFLGDVGSVPLGFLLGGLLLRLAMGGQLAAALILPAYYVADATLTIILRIVRGEPFLRPHRQHFYQRAALGRHRHDQVALAVLVGNLALIACALLAAQGRVAEGAGAAFLVVAAMLTMLQRWSRP